MRLIRLLKHELSSDAAQWVDAGIISGSQAQSILSLYGTELPTGKRLAMGHYVLLALAALFAGLAAIVFISGNWEEIPRAARMIGLIALTVLCNAAGIRLYFKERVDGARIWFFLGAMLYGASIFLIAQIYHLGEYFPNGVLLWAIGVVPFALLTKSCLLMFLASVLSQIWLLMEGAHGYFPTLYPLLGAAGLWFCLVQRKSIVVFLFTVVGIVTYSEFVLEQMVGSHSHAFDLEPEHIYFTTGIFILLYYLGCAMEAKSQRSDIVEYGLSLRIWSLRFGLLTLFILSFEDCWRELLRDSLQSKGFISIWLLVVLLIPPLVQLISNAGGRISISSLLGSELREYSSTYTFLAAFAVFNILVLSATSNNYADIALALAVFTNFVLLAMGIWLLCKAFATETSGYFYLGLSIILFTALLRYFDLIGDYIGGSLLFLAAAGVMYMSALGWKRYLTSKGGTAQ